VPAHLAKRLFEALHDDNDKLRNLPSRIQQLSLEMGHVLEVRNGDAITVAAWDPYFSPDESPDDTRFAFDSIDSWARVQIVGSP
jgi:hypothetical protein